MRLTLIVLSMAIALCVRVFGEDDPPQSLTDSERAGLYVSQPKAMAQIEERIARLRAETVEESLERLDRINEYGSATIYHNSDVSWTIPLAGSEGSTDIELIVSNRRVVRVIHHLRGLPEAEAAAAINAALPRFLEDYTRQFEEQVQPNGVVVTSSQPGDNGDGSPTLSGSRLAVLSLCYIAGALELGGTRDAVDMVIDSALSQRDWLYNVQKNGIATTRAASLLVQSSLYCRQVLLAAVMGIHKKKAEVAELFLDLPVENPDELWTKFTITAFDALITPFDVPARFGTKPDYTRGYMAVPNVVWCDDSHFDEALALVRE